MYNSYIFKFHRKQNNIGFLLDKPMTNIWALYSPWLSVSEILHFKLISIYRLCPRFICCEQKLKSERYLRAHAGIVLSLCTFFSAQKWAEIETQILFLPIRKRKPG